MYSCSHNYLLVYLSYVATTTGCLEHSPEFVGVAGLVVVSRRKRVDQQALRRHGAGIVEQTAGG